MQGGSLSKATLLFVLAIWFAACSPTPESGEQGARSPATSTSDPTNGRVASPRPGGPPSHQPDYVPGQLLVRFEPSTPEAERQKVRARHSLAKIQDFSTPGLELDEILDSGRSPERALEVSQEPSVRYAEPNKIVRIQR